MAQPGDLVLRFDLSREEAGLLNGDVYEAQKARASETAELGHRDIGRMLLIDDVDAVFDHEQMIERVMDAESVTAVLLVLIGKPSASWRPGDGLRLPALVEHPKAAAVWVADEQGVLWARGEARPSTLVDKSDDGLSALRRALTDPGVFDDVYDAIHRMWPRVASPGLRVKTIETTPSAAVKVAIQQAGRTVGGDTPGEGADPTLIDELQWLMGGARADGGVFDRQSELMTTVGEVRKNLNDALQAAEASEKWPSARYSLLEADGALDRAGPALAHAFRKLRNGFDLVDVSYGISAENLIAMRRFGVAKSPEQAVVAQLSTDDPAQQAPDRAVRRVGFRILQTSRSLSYAAERLQTMASRARPRSKQEITRLIENEHRADIPNAMATSLPFSLDLLVPGVVLASLLIGFLASLWEPGRVVGVPLALLCVLISGTILSSGTARVDPREVFWRVVRQPLDFVVLLAAAGLGALLATLLPPIPERLWAVGVLSLLASIAATVVLVKVVWRRRYVPWRRRRLLDEATKELDRLGTVARDVVLNDWLLADARRRGAIVAEGVASCMERVREILVSEHSILERLDRSQDEAPADRDPLDGRGTPAVRIDLAPYSASVRDIVIEDLLAMAIDVIDRVDHGAAVTADDAAVIETERHFTDALSHYVTDLENHGVLEPRRNPDANRLRDQLLARLWGEALDMHDVLNPGPNAEFVQYCSPEALRLLSESPESARLVRFAPAIAERLLRSTRSGQDSVLLARGNDVAGALRLVPLREGAIVIPRAEEDSDLSDDEYDE